MNWTTVVIDGEGPSVFSDLQTTASWPAFPSVSCIGFSCLPGSGLGSSCGRPLCLLAARTQSSGTGPGQGHSLRINLRMIRSVIEQAADDFPVADYVHLRSLRLEASDHVRKARAGSHHK